MYGTYCGRILFKDGADKLQNNREARVDDSPRHFSTAQLNFAHGFDVKDETNEEFCGCYVSSNQSERYSILMNND